MTLSQGKQLTTKEKNGIPRDPNLLFSFEILEQSADHLAGRAEVVAIF